jgi:hypothetical protein
VFPESHRPASQHWADDVHARPATVQQVIVEKKHADGAQQSEDSPHAVPPAIGPHGLQ